MSRLKAFAAGFHEYVTPLRCALVYATITVICLGVTLPIIAVVKHNQKQNHQDVATNISVNMASYVDAQVERMFAAIDLFIGFVASGAPLLAPNYTEQNASERVREALTVGTTGSLSYESFLRLHQMASRIFDGFSTAIVRPGLVNVYSQTGFNESGQDLFYNGPDEADREYTYMVSTRKHVVRGPLPPSQVVGATSTINLVIRSPIFTQYNNLSTDVSAIDPNTHRHPNWNYLWGGVSVVMDVDKLGDNPVFAELAGPDYHYLFESLPNTDRFLPTEYIVVANTTPQQNYRHAVVACAETPNFTNLCFRVMPRNGWNGDDMPSSLATAALLDVFIPLIIIGIIIIAARVMLGPRPDPLQDAPRKVPFHAVCVDMAGANKMWGEVPFVMSEVTRVFTDRLEALASDHRVHIGLRMGNTVILISAHRTRIINFTQALSSWAATQQWPLHVLIHCPFTTITFTFVLHTCEQATLWVDPARTQCEAGGPDIQLLLLLRAAAVPGHVLCTGPFLGIHENHEQQRPGDRASGHSSTAPSTEHSNVATVRLLQEVRELGVCYAPCAGRSTASVRGFVMPSAATEQKRLALVVDAFPRWVWQEWRAPHELVPQRAGDGPSSSGGDARVSGSSNENPLSAAPLPRALPVEDATVDRTVDRTFDRGSAASRGSGGIHTASGTMSRSKTTSIATSKRDLTDAHSENSEAALELPGSAVDLHDARRIASVIAPFVMGKVERNRNVDAMATAVDRLRQLTSLATFFLVAYRVVLSPIEPKVQDAIILQIAAATGIPAEHFHYNLAARCARLCQQYVH
jgi:hypothetical protein